VKPIVIVALIALTIAGFGVYALTRREPTASERITDVALRPFESLATSIAIAPWVITLVIVIVVGALAVTLVRSPGALLGAVK
jgi:Zn-dependent protease